MSALCPTGEYCATCERIIDWDGHTESSHLRAELGIAVAALKAIRDQDYRGNRPFEAYIAEGALKAIGRES